MFGGFLNFVSSSLAAVFPPASPISPPPAPIQTVIPQPAPTMGVPVSVYVTTPDLTRTLHRENDLHFSSAPLKSAGVLVSVNPGRRYQSLSAGFGISLTDTSAWLLQEVLPPARRDAAMASLFSPTEGIGLTYLRVGIGGTDYNVSRTGYTYNDLPKGQTDPTLSRFSIAHDHQYIIPAVQQALRLNPRIVMTASPWSPPAWMKTDESLVPTRITSKLKPDAFEPWAQYITKFLEGYAEAGIRFDHISIQNEPVNSPLIIPGMFTGETFIPGLWLPPQDAVKLVNDHLAPAFQARNIDTKIAVWEFLPTLGNLYIPLVMAGAGKNVGALAYHCYADSEAPMSQMRDKYRLPIYQTECSSKLNTIEPAQMIIRNLNNWAEGVQLWNAALDPQGGPKFGSGCRGLPFSKFAGQECTAPITVDPVTKTYKFTADYWALAHFSKFIKLGATRIDASGLMSCKGGLFPQPCRLEGTLFENPDRSRALVVTTDSQTPVPFVINDNGKHVSYTLPARSTATLVWRP